ncbi:cytochrome c551 peroxidase [Leptospira kobayashii]|uniref:Cytochrome c551 peroxidase n=2 Tax=Leptospira kobayashii TaxID=1917830 RepID=A0ABM7UJ01_9LEPT|nr:cytochrome c551 peroxidase [Leptospira kobayashii]
MSSLKKFSRRMKVFTLLGLLLTFLIFFGCKEDKTPKGANDFSYVPSGILGLPDVPIPKDNPPSREKIELGAKLYNDTRFSSDGTVSCATCHKPDKAFTDGLKVSQGIRKLTGTRNAPTVLNAVFLKTQFWDGRRPDLEGQSKDPLLNPVEHGLSSHEDLLKIIRSDSDYLAKFKKVFSVDENLVTIDHVAKAIAAFERTIISGDSPFDRYRYGKDTNAISPAAIRGLAVYLGKGRCQDCHTIGDTSAVFFDDKFHNLGVGFKKIQPRLQIILEETAKAKKSGSKKTDEEILTNLESSELGRFAVTGNTEDLGAFKTPGLRNITLTAPYMHDGSLNSLEQVIELYDKGGEENPFLSSGIRPLGLSPGEKSDLVAFLKTLTSPKLPGLPSPNNK